MSSLELPCRLPSGIYAIVNRLDGKVYVGQAQDIQKRERVHRSELRGGYHHSQHLQRAWNKYGESAFYFVTLRDDLEPGQLTPHEQLWMDLLEPAYNVLRAANSSKGYKHTLATRARLSELNRLRPKKPRAPYNFSPEGRRRLSEARKAHPATTKSVEAMRAANTGKPRSAATRQRISDSKRGRSHSPELQAKLTAARQTPEYRAKMSAIRKATIKRKAEAGT